MRRVRGAGLWLAVLLAGALVLAATTAGAANKPYSLNVSTAAPTFDTQAGVTGSGQTVSITAAIKNENTTQQMGSVNLFPPSSAFDTNFQHGPDGFVIQSVASASIVGGSALGACSPGSSAPCFLPASGKATPSCTYGAFTAPCVELRNLSLAPGGEVDVTVNVKTPACEGSPSGTAFAWNAEVKQANNFSGSPGNDLTLDGGNSFITTSLDGACSLAFVAQPHDAVTSATITDTDWSTSGGPVTVEVLGADGTTQLTASTAQVALGFASNLGGATLTGGGAQGAVSGLATFAGLSIDRPGVYSLAASSGTLTGTSQSFTISDTKIDCPSGVDCTGSQFDNNGNGTTVTSNDGSGPAYFLLISTNVNGNQLSCSAAKYGGYTSADPNTYDTFTTVGAAKVVAIRINTPIGVSGNANKVLRAQQICFGATTDFVTNPATNPQTMAAAGTLPDGTAGFIGLLPDCSASSTGPCHNRQQDTTIPDPKRHIGYDIVLVFDIPANFTGDPFHH